MTEVKNIKETEAYLKVQVPVELTQYVMLERSYCGKYVTKRAKGNNTHIFSKVMGLYILLKAESPGTSLIQNYAKQIPTLAANFSLSVRSFYSHLGALEKLKLVSKDGGNLRVSSWQQLGKILDINTTKREHINFYYDGKQKMHWWFAAIEIKENQERQAFMIWKKVNRNSEVKNSLLSALIQRGFDTTKADNPEYYSGRLFMLYAEDFKSGTEVHDLLVLIRSDVNRTIKKIARSWKMSPQLATYWKVQMRKKKIIDVAKVAIQSEWTRETNECHKRQGCHVIWSDKLKERIWFLCDQITVLMPWKWTEKLELLKAA